MKAVAYIRVSTTRQGSDGLGAQAQRELISSYVKVYPSIEIVEWITDEESGGDLKRPGIKRALEMIESGDVQALVVGKLDRLSRSTRDFANILDRYFSRPDRRLCVVSEAIDSATPVGQLLGSVLMAFAAFELACIKTRTRAALAVKRERGEATGGSAPYGWRKVEGRLVADEKEQENLTIMKHLREREKFSFPRIADFLNRSERSRATRCGGVWSASSVQRTLVRADRIAEGIRKGMAEQKKGRG